jgi:RNA polymerase sigma-70 factor (ECF subfamily)
MKTRSESKPSDEALLARAMAWPADRHTRQAASELLERYQDRVYLWCFRYVRDHEQALDLAQEVLLKAYRSLATFQGKSRFSSWLFAIARNRCLSELRRPSLLFDPESDPDAMATQAASPGRQLEEKLAEEEVLDLIRNHLEPREQEALWLRCFERLPVDAITRMLHISEASGARAVLQSARRKLRAALQDRGLAMDGAES